MLGLFIVLSSAPGWGLFHSGNPVRVFSIQEFFLIPLFRASCSCFEHTVLVLCVGEKPLAGENLWSSQASGVRSCCGSVSWLLWKAPVGRCSHIHAHMCTYTHVHGHRHACTCMHTQACSCTHMHTQTCAHNKQHTLTHAQALMQCTCAHMHIHIIHTLTCTYMHTYTYTLQTELTSQGCPGQGFRALLKWDYL